MKKRFRGTKDFKVFISMDLIGWLELISDTLPRRYDYCTHEMYTKKVDAFGK